MAENDYWQIDDRSLVELLLRDDDKAWDCNCIGTFLKRPQHRCAEDFPCAKAPVFDVDERAVPSSVLTFCGIDLDRDEGYAFMPMGEFRKNMRGAMIALRRGDGDSVPGKLTAAHGI